MYMCFYVMFLEQEPRDFAPSPRHVYLHRLYLEISKFCHMFICWSPSDNQTHKIVLIHKYSLLDIRI